MSNKNNKPKVLVTEPLPRLETGFKLLEDIAQIKQKEEFTGKIKPDEVEEINAIIAGDSKISEDTLERADKLKIVARHGVGYDNIDIDACTERGILVTNVRIAEGPSVPEQAMSLLLAISKKIKERDKMIREGRWDERNELVGKEISGKTLGIIGLGNIGKGTAKLAKGFDMNVLAYDPYIESEEAKKIGVNLCNLDNLLKKSDFISIHCPLSEETRKLIGREEFEKMNEETILINTARGAIIEEEALVEALKTNEIKAAGLDVLKNEPVLEHELFELDNTILTPHSAAFTEESLRRAAEVVCSNVRKVLEGNRPKNVINPEALSSR